MRAKTTTTKELWGLRKEPSKIAIGKMGRAMEGETNENTR